MMRISGRHFFTKIFFFHFFSVSAYEIREGFENFIDGGFEDSECNVSLVFLLENSFLVKIYRFKNMKTVYEDKKFNKLGKKV